MPSGGCCLAMSKACSRACGSARSVAQPCSSHSRMRPLCAVFAFVRGRTSDPGLALAALDGLDRSRASTTRRQVVRRLAQDIDSAGDLGFQMVLDEVRSDPEFDEALAARVGTELWRREPASFVGALVGTDLLSPAANAALAQIDTADLMRGISRDPGTAPEIAKRRGDLLVAEGFWTVPGIDIERTIASSEHRSERVVSSLVSSVASVSRSAAEQFEGRAIIGALERVGSLLGRDHIEPWLQALRGHTHDLISALRNREFKFAPSISRLAHAIDPDDVFCDERGDPWFDAISGMAGGLTTEEDAHLCAFLLARGLGRQSMDPAALMRLSLEKVHRALAGNRMPPDGWRMLRNQLPFVMPWQEWDRCWRVRSAVGAKFVERNLNISDFVNLVDDLELWWQVASDTSHGWGGWKYLKQVQRRLEVDGADDPGGRKLAALRSIL
jgi:hypothetical protein